MFGQFEDHNRDPACVTLHVTEDVTMSRDISGHVTVALRPRYAGSCLAVTES